MEYPLITYEHSVVNSPTVMIPNPWEVRMKNTIKAQKVLDNIRRLSGEEIQFVLRELKFYTSGIVEKTIYAQKVVDAFNSLSAEEKQFIINHLGLRYAVDVAAAEKRESNRINSYLKNCVLGERYFFIKKYDTTGKASQFLDKPLPVGQETYEGVRSGKLQEKKPVYYREKFQGFELTFVDIINNKGEPQEKPVFIDLKNYNIYSMSPKATMTRLTNGGFYRRHTRKHGTVKRRRKQNRRRGTC